MDDLKYCETSGIICTLPFTMSAILSFQGLCIAATSLLLTTDTYTVNRQSGPFGLGTCMCLTQTEQRLPVADKVIVTRSHDGPRAHRTSRCGLD